MSGARNRTTLPWVPAVKLFESIVGQNNAHTNLDVEGSVNNCENTLIGTTSGITQLANDGGNLFDVPPLVDLRVPSGR